MKYHEFIAYSLDSLTPRTKLGFRLTATASLTPLIPQSVLLWARTVRYYSKRELVHHFGRLLAPPPALTDGLCKNPGAGVVDEEMCCDGGFQHMCGLGAEETVAARQQLRLSRVDELADVVEDF
jgi:hypothetical protein